MGNTHPHAASGDVSCMAPEPGIPAKLQGDPASDLEWSIVHPTSLYAAMGDQNSGDESNGSSNDVTSDEDEEEAPPFRDEVDEGRLVDAQGRSLHPLQLSQENLAFENIQSYLPAEAVSAHAPDESFTGSSGLGMEDSITLPETILGGSRSHNVKDDGSRAETYPPVPDLTGNAPEDAEEFFDSQEILAEDAGNDRYPSYSEDDDDSDETYESMDEEPRDIYVTDQDKTVCVVGDGGDVKASEERGEEETESKYAVAEDEEERLMDGCSDQEDTMVEPVHNEVKDLLQNDVADVDIESEVNAPVQFAAPQDEEEEGHAEHGDAPEDGTNGESVENDTDRESDEDDRDRESDKDDRDRESDEDDRDGEGDAPYMDWREVCEDVWDSLMDYSRRVKHPAQLSHHAMAESMLEEEKDVPENDIANIDSTKSDATTPQQFATPQDWEGEGQT